MTADALKKVTTGAIDTLAEILDEDHSESDHRAVQDHGTGLQVLLAQRVAHFQPCPTSTRAAGFQTGRTMGSYV